MSGDLAIQDDDGSERTGRAIDGASAGDGSTDAEASRSAAMVKPKRGRPTQQDQSVSHVVPATAQRSSRASPLSLIDALSNPNISVDQIERIASLERDLVAREARVAYAAALSRMQTELPIIQERGGIKDRAGNVMSRYALWEDIVGVVTPVLARHGFSLTFRTSSADALVTVTGVLTHCEGHEERTSLTLPIDSSGAKNVVQSIGSSTSYGKRYTASALLNLRSGTSEDDDGLRGGGAARISESQAADIEALITEVGANKQAMLEWLKVSSVEDIPASKFADVVAKLEAKRK